MAPYVGFTEAEVHDLFISIQPFADIVGYYTCHDGKNKCNKYFLHIHAPFPGLV